MFTEKQISYMKEIGLNLDFDNLSDEDWCNIEETVGDRLVLHCLDENYNPTSEGLMCESIIDKLPKD